MILQSLAHYYQRLQEQGASGLAPYGYSSEKISYEILLAPDGSIVAVQSVLDTSGKKPKPRAMIVPQPEKRTAGIKSNFLWDKTGYVLGVSATSKRTEQEHAAFRSLHFDVLADENDAGLAALVAFLQKWQPEQFQVFGFPEEMKDTNVVFRLDGENRHLHERPAAKLVRARLLRSSDVVLKTPESGFKEKTDHHVSPANTICLITGEQAPAARLHPAIKGVQGAQTAGASIVSFNQNAFTSFGKEQGENAPVSQQAAFAYTTALNYLLRRTPDNRQRIQIGDTSVVFWAEAATSAQAAAVELFFASFLSDTLDDNTEASRVRGVLELVRQGRPMSEATAAPDLDPATRIFVLGLAPNASRLSVRFWLMDSLQHLIEKLTQHEKDLRIEPRPWKTAPAVRRLVLATVPNREGAMPKVEDAPENLVGETMRAILTGGQYPLSLLANTIMRIRSDGAVSGLRIALCKGILTRKRRLLKQTSYEEIPVSLDTKSTQPAYLLGRLFAVLEDAQRNALGGQVSATIRDRYYGAASATPASIFPVLLRNTQNHLAKVRKEHVGRAVALEKQLRNIVDGLPQQFPRSFNIEDQGRFAIGYYHQSQARFNKTDIATAVDDSAGTDEHGIEQGESV